MAKPKRTVAKKRLSASASKLISSRRRDRSPASTSSARSTSSSWTSSVRSKTPQNRNVAKKSTTQISPRRMSKVQESESPAKIIREAEMKKLVHDCVYYLLIADQRKYPIKKAEIVKNVVRGKGRLFNSVLEKANKLLNQVYGIKIQEVPLKKDSYILLNMHSHLDLSEHTEGQLVQQGLLFLVLTVIFLNDGPVAESDMWKMLKVMGVEDPAKVHPVLGDVKKLLTHEWVKQLYLVYDPAVLNADPPKYQFSWGYRAKQEVDKKVMSAFAAKVTGSDDEALAQLASELGENSSD